MFELSGLLFYLSADCSRNMHLRRVELLVNKIKVILGLDQIFIASEIDSLRLQNREISTISCESAKQKFNGFLAISSFESFEVFRSAEKANGQLWFLFLDCWQVHPQQILTADELEEIDAIVVLSEAHKTECVLNDWPIEKLCVVPYSIDESKSESAERDPFSVIWISDGLNDRDFSLIGQQLKIAKSEIPQLTVSFQFSQHIPEWFLSSAERDQSFMEAIEVSLIVDLNDLYQKHSVIVIPPGNRVHSLQAIEAQARGCIPVLVREGDCFNSVVPMVSGIICDSADPQLLREVMVSMLQVLTKNSSVREVAIDFTHRVFNPLFPACAFLQLLVKQC